MDITKSQKIRFTTKHINGETVNYGVVYFLGLIAFLVLKQILKSALFSVSAPAAVSVSFAVVMIIMFFAEKKAVFTHSVMNSSLKQIIFYVFRCLVDFGFFKIFDFIFVSLLKLHDIIPYVFSLILMFVFNYYFDRLLVFDCRADAQKNINGRCYRLYFRNRFVVLSMVAAAAGILFIYMIFSLFPFGDTTVLRMDLYHQYGPLFAEFYDRITNLDSFLYSWNSGGGSSFLGNYFNYLSSPLSLIVLLFDRKDVGYAITTLVAIKGVLSAGTFSYFLKKSFDRHSYSSSAFGVFYAFCGYFLAYYWNIMWIDGMIFLPLIALGIERIINKGKGGLYIASLSLLFFSSYYIGYMTCLFSVLYFILYYFANHNGNDKIANTDGEKLSLYKKLTNNLFVNRGIRFAVCSVICGALCACFLIPVYYILQSCSATSDSFPSRFESYFNILDMLSSHLAGLTTTIRSSGDDVLPNLYSGILAVILLPLYLINKDIRLKEKIMYLLLLLFFVFSFDNNIMNFVWHALHFPNDLPYRFSFMYTFVLLVVAYRGLMHIKSIEYRDIAMVGMLWVLLILLFQKFPTNKISESCIYISLAFVMVWTCVLLLIKKGKMSDFVIGFTIIAITFCEVIVADSNSYEFTQNQRDYTSNYETYEDAINYTYDHDDEFYRTELCYLDTRMDPCLYGYRGMSIFSSMAYENYSQSQYSLGMFGNRINSYTYNTQTPVYNMMFNIKYLMRKSDTIEPSEDFYSFYYQTEDRKTTVYKNDYHLPIAFVTSADVRDWDNSEGNPFEAQESFIDNAAGVSNVFVPVKYISTESDCADCEDVISNGTFSFTKTENESGSIDILIETVKDGNLYIYITSPSIENVNYFWGDDEVSEYQGIGEPYILDLGKHSKGERITISLDMNAVNDTSSYFEIYSYNIDKDVFSSAYDLLKLGGLEVTNHSDTMIEGKINAGYDGFIYTSIPYDEGWSVYIDGEKVKTFDIGDSHLCTTIKHGEHTVVFRYRPRGQRIGIIITGVTAVCLFGYGILKRRKLRHSAVTD